MAITQTPRLKLQKQASGDANWHTGLNDGLDNADLRLVTTGAGSPVGVAEGFFVGAFYVQTAPVRLWICTVVGTPGTWVDVIGSGGEILAALILANAIPLQGKESGGTARNLAVMSAANKVLLGALTNLLTLQTNGALGLKVEYGSGEQTIWHAGNDGVGSGLDADLHAGLAIGSVLNFGAGMYAEEIAVQTPAHNSVKTFNHLLVTVPRLFDVRLRCATPENGYVANDEVPFMFSSNTFPTTSIAFCNATVVGVSIGAAIAMGHKTTGGQASANPAFWRLVFRAWK